MKDLSMATCWRCGGGKTITVTTTGTHVFPCPTCGATGHLPLEEEKRAAVSQPPEAKKLTATKPPVDSSARAGSKVVSLAPAIS
jgi:hypothetical protein